MLHFLPTICVGCGFTSNIPGLDLCSYCYTYLPWLDERCYQCGGKFKLPQEAVLCDICLNHPPAFTRLCALFDYAPPLNKLINRLKFNRDLYPTQLFARLLTAAITQRWYLNKPLPEIIIPVPLHHKRQRVRGFNQALEICKPLAKALYLPLDLNLCQRVKYTLAQARLSKQQRIKNVKHAFSAKGINKYNSVVIVDDVVTTGSTVQALSLALLKAGVENIEVWCVCRG